MQILIVRHAIAEEREDFARSGCPDEERPLTSEGRKKMRQAAEALRDLAPAVEVIGTSPLLRAAQTAAILSEAYGGTEPIVVTALAPGQGPERALRWARSQRRSGTIALVGHEPGLSRLASWLLGIGLRSALSLKKGGACLVEFPGLPRAGRGTLLWLLTPGQLRGLRG